MDSWVGGWLNINVTVRADAQMCVCTEPEECDAGGEGLLWRVEEFCAVYWCVMHRKTLRCSEMQCDACIVKALHHTPSHMGSTRT